VIILKLNPDCTRALLLVLEENLKFQSDHNFISIEPIHLKQVCAFDGLASYDMADIAYSAVMLTEADFIEAHIVDFSEGIADILFFSLTYEGHKYLDSIRNDSVWDATKKILQEKAFSGSFDLIGKIATSLLFNATGLSL